MNDIIRMIENSILPGLLAVLICVFIWAVFVMGQKTARVDCVKETAFLEGGKAYRCVEVSK